MFIAVTSCGAPESEQYRWCCSTALQMQVKESRGLCWGETAVPAAGQVLPSAAIEEEEAEEEEEEEEEAPDEAPQPVAEVAEAAKPLGGLFGRAKRGAKAAADEAEELADEAPQVPARRAAAPHALWRHLVSRCVPGPVVLVLVCSCTTAHRSAKATAEQ